MSETTAEPPTATSPERKRAATKGDPNRKTAGHDQKERNRAASGGRVRDRDTLPRIKKRGKPAAAKSTGNQPTMKNSIETPCTKLHQDTASRFCADGVKMPVYQRFSRNDTQRTEPKRNDTKNIIDYLKK